MTLNKWLHLALDPEQQREADTSLSRMSGVSCSFFPSPTQNLPMCLSAKDRKAPVVFHHWLCYEYIKQILSALVSQFCLQLLVSQEGHSCKAVEDLINGKYHFVYNHLSALVLSFDDYYTELSFVMGRLWHLILTSVIFYFVLWVSWCGYEIDYVDFKWFDIYNCPEYTRKHRTNFIKCGDADK